MKARSDNYIMRISPVVTILVLLLFLFPAPSGQAIPEHITVSESDIFNLPCIWSDGETKAIYPPEPLNRLRYKMRIPAKLNFTKGNPSEVDFFYPKRLLNNVVLMNTLTSYSKKYSFPEISNEYTILQQYADEDFLVMFNQKGEDQEGHTTLSYLFFLANPYQSQSRFLFATQEKGAGKHFIGSFSKTPQHGFIINNQLYLYTNETLPMTLEAHFPNAIRFLSTDNEDLLFFLSSGRTITLKAYSLSRHKVVWENPNLIDNQDQIDSARITRFSHNPDLILVSFTHYLILLSTKTGEAIKSFTLPSEFDNAEVHFREMNGNVWIQYYITNQEGIYQNLYQIKLSPNKDLSFPIQLFQIEETALIETKKGFAPVYYAYIPAYQKLLIVYKNQDKLESQAVFQLP